MNEFCALLPGLREAAGFRSARAFFSANGGRAFFGCTYKQYLNVEGGRSIPQPLLVERLASALRVAVDEAQARRFALAYLRAALGREGLVDFIVGAVSGKPSGPANPLRQALRRSYSERAEPLSAEQSELIRDSRESYWCFTLLANDKARRAASELAATLGCAEPAVSRALEKLAKAKLVAQGKDGRWHCPKVGRVFLHPRDELYTPKVIASLRRRWDEMAETQGAPLLHQHLFTRASESALRAYFPYLAQTVHGADVYSTSEKGPDTAFFLVEAVVRRIMPF